MKRSLDPDPDNPPVGTIDVSLNVQEFHLLLNDACTTGNITTLSDRHLAALVLCQALMKKAGDPLGELSSEYLIVKLSEVLGCCDHSQVAIMPDKSGDPERRRVLITRPHAPKLN